MSDDPWTLYWQADNADSCISSGSETDAEQISAFWQDFAATLANGASVLDLATGNGAVPLALIRGNASLNITGVDRAKIDPLRYLSSPGLLQGVTFVGGVDVCCMPFDAASFDAVSSQFGIEYAPLDDAIAEATRVLKSGGRLNFLMHHAGSEVVDPAKIKLREMQSLLRTGGVIERLAGFVGGNAGADELDASGREHIESGAGRSAGISGQVFEGVNRIIQSMGQGDAQAALELAAVMTTRLRADHDRLWQLVDAALAEEEVESLTGQLERGGVSIGTMAPYRVHQGSELEALLGWHLSGTKR